jgi:hypothetical protein
MASSAGLRNNPSTGVPNNRNNSSRTALAGDQMTPLEGNNNSGFALTRGQVNPLGNNNTNPQEDLVKIVQ